MKKLLIILIFFTTSCMKYTDLRKLSIIKNIGISYHDEYTLYAVIYDEIKKDNEPKTKVVKSSGKTIKEAFENITNNSNKEIFLSHIDLLIFDENLIDKNYQEIINYFINNKNTRNSFSCIFSDNIMTLFTNSNYDEIENYLDTNKNITVDSSFDIIADSYLNHKSFSLPMIVYNQKIEFNGNYTFYNNQIERITDEKN